MQWGFSEEHIFLEKKDILKVSRFIERELGITNIQEINATPDSFEIVRLCHSEEDSLAKDIRDITQIVSAQRFLKFAKNHNKIEQLKNSNGTNKTDIGEDEE